MCQLPSPGVQVRASPLWRRTWGTGQQRGQRAWHRPPRPSPETHIAKKNHRLGGCHRCCQVLCWGRGSLCHGSCAHIELRGPWWSPLPILTVLGSFVPRLWHPISAHLGHLSSPIHLPDLVFSPSSFTLWHPLNAIPLVLCIPESSSQARSKKKKSKFLVGYV